MYVFLSQDKMNFTRQNCKLIGLLENQIQSLDERIGTLHEIKEGEDFINRSHEVLHRDREGSKRDNRFVDFPNKPLSATA